MADAGTGYVDIDLLLDVAAGLGVLPDDTTVVDVEPPTTWPSTELSAPGALALTAALDVARGVIATVVPTAFDPLSASPA